MNNTTSEGRLQTIIGLDIGGSKIAVVEGTGEARILQRCEVAAEAHRPFAERFPELAAIVDNVVAQARANGREVKALSVSVGGPLRILEGALLDPPHLPGWHNVALKDVLSARFPGLPVYVEHDGNAGALAEFYFGVGRGRPRLEHLIFLTFGTGLGAGFIINGRILHGATDTAGEVGHWRLADNGPVGFGKEGSWEAFASGAGLVQLAARWYPARWSEQSSIRELVAAMLAGDEDALNVADEAGAWMGKGIALLIDALNPQVIVVGSLAVVLGDLILRPVRREVAEEALPQAAAACEILPAALGTGIGDVASLMAALSDPAMKQVLEGDPGE